MYTLEVNNPDFPKDFEFDCDGILVKNGSSTKVTKEMEEAFVARWNGVGVKDIYGHESVPDSIKLTGSTALSGGGE